MESAYIRDSLNIADIIVDSMNTLDEYSRFDEFDSLLVC